MTVPDLGVEFAFGKGPFETPGINDWTNVSDICRGASIQRGRNHELSRSHAGRAHIRLRNIDRWFEPTNPLSPYYPDVVPMCQVRLTATHLGITYPLFYGFVEDWDQTWSPRPMNSQGDAECVVQAVDGFKLLSLFKVEGTALYAGLDAGAQITAILDAIGWPASLRAIDTGVSAMSALEPSSSALDDMLSIGEDSDQGLLQMSADGKVVFHSRAGMLNHSAITATFGDTTGSIPYSDVSLQYGDQDLYTRVVASRPEGIEQINEDATASLQFGPRTLVKTGLRLATDGEVEGYADYLRRRYSAPEWRVTNVTFAAASDANWPILLERDTHHDKVTAIRTPPGGGDPIVEDVHIEGVSDDIVPGISWQRSFSLVPAFAGDFWILDDSVEGVLETTARLFIW